MKRLKLNFDIGDIKVGDRLKPKPLGVLQSELPDFYRKSEEWYSRAIEPYEYLTVKSIFSTSFMCEETNCGYSIEQFYGVLDDNGKVTGNYFDREEYFLENIINAFDFEKFSNKELQSIIGYMFLEKYGRKQDIDRLKETINKIINEGRDYIEEIILQA